MSEGAAERAEKLLQVLPLVEQAVVRLRRELGELIREMGAVPKKGRVSDKWSAEREALLREIYPSAHGLAPVVEAINTLPGQKLTAKAVGMRAHYRRLKKNATKFDPPTRPENAETERSASVAKAAPPARRRMAELMAAVDDLGGTIAPEKAPGPRLIVADLDQIRSFLVQRGQPANHIHIDVVNAYCATIGHPPFLLGERASEERVAAFAHSIGLNTTALFVVNGERQRRGLPLFMVPGRATERQI